MHWFDKRSTFFSDKNLALEGKAYQSDGVIGTKAFAAIDGNTARKPTHSRYPRSLVVNGKAWFRIEFVKFIEVFAIKIWPGKLERCTFGC